MSLDLALSNAKSALNAAQQLISTSSNNISNYRTDNYSKREVELESSIIGGAVNGVVVSGIVTKIDKYLRANLLNQSSELSYANTINDYNEDIQILLGSPNAKDGLDYNINELFSSLKSLSTNPELSSIRYDTVNKAQNLVAQISDISLNLHNLRLNADRDIKLAADLVTEQLSIIESVNSNIPSTDKSNSSQVDLLQIRDTAINEIAKKLNISIYYEPNNKVQINTTEGLPLIDQKAYILEYNPINSVQNLIDNYMLSPLTAYNINGNGDRINNIELISSGVGEFGGNNSSIISKIKTGEIEALRELRDNTIPLIIDQLDNLAFSITNEFNKIHNSGSGFPPPSELTGTRATHLNDIKSFSGNVRIGIVDQSGKALVKPDGTKLNPLLMDLSNISSSNINGQANIETLIDEINQYFYINPTINTTSLGNISDIKIVAKSPLTIEPNGIFTFDFELENNSQNDSIFEIISLNISDPGCIGLIGSLPNGDEIEAGIRARTNNPIAVNFSGGAGGPYNIQTQLRVTDSIGNVSTSIITFQIDDNPGNLNIQNKRYLANNVISGSASINPPNNVTRYVYASLVDYQGNIVNDNNPGNLQIKTLDNNYFISIDDLDSSENGLPQTNNSLAVIGTNKGFSEYFELNDFFVRNKNFDQATNNALMNGSAINFSVRSDIVKNPQLMSLGKLSQSQSYSKSVNVGENSAYGSIKFSNNPSIGDSLNINGTIFTFVTSSSSPNQITIGTDLAITLNNMISTLNAVNSTTIANTNLAEYSNNGADSLIINYKVPGLGGNLFTISGNFSMITASINSNSSISNPSGNLLGGSNIDKMSVITPWTYELGVGNNAIIKKLAALSNYNINIQAAGGLPASYETINSYISTIIANRATEANSASRIKDQQTILYNAYNEKIQNTTGVNIDQEMMNVKQYQTYYSSAAKMAGIVNDLYNVLLSIVRVN